MGAGVNGGAMVVAVDLVLEAINTGTDLAAPHLPNMEETLALVHRPNQLCAMTIVVQVRKCEKKIPDFTHRFDFLFIQLSFAFKIFVALHYTAKGYTCTNMGRRDLPTEEDCRNAVNYAKSTINGNAIYRYSVSWAYHHKGCFIYVDGSMYFNSHYSGSNNADLRSICYT